MLPISQCTENWITQLQIWWRYQTFYNNNPKDNDKLVAQKCRVLPKLTTCIFFALQFCENYVMSQMQSQSYWWLLNKQAMFRLWQTGPYERGLSNTTWASWHKQGKRQADLGHCPDSQTIGGFSVTCQHNSTSHDAGFNATTQDARKNEYFNPAGGPGV